MQAIKKICNLIVFTFVVLWNTVFSATVPFNSRPESGETGTKLAWNNLQADDLASYDVLVTEPLVTVASDSAQSTELIPPVQVNSTSPVLYEAVQGQDVVISLEINTDATQPVGYRWRRGFTLLEHFQDAGIKSTIRIENVQPSTIFFNTNITVTVTNQANFSPGLTVTNFLVVLADTDGDGIPDQYEEENGFNPEDPSDAYFDADLDGASNYEEYLGKTDPNDPSSFPDVILIQKGSRWSFFDLGSDLGSSWRDLNYNDSSWPNGLAELGYGDGDEATVVSYGEDAQNKHITTYFRHFFNVIDPLSYQGLRGTLSYDDGAAVYLNGSEIFRVNLANDAGFGTLAEVQAEFHSTNFYAAADHLVTGGNLLAVEVHQADPASSDISFDLELAAMMRGAPTIFAQPKSITVCTNATAQLAVEATGSSPLHYQWRKNGDNIDGATGAVLSLTNLNVSAGGSYQVVVANGQGITISSNAVVCFCHELVPFVEMANDFSVAQSVGPMSGYTGTVQTTNESADKETGEPNHGGESGGKSVWFHWQAPANGIARFDTHGSTFDTLLGVYRGNSLSTLKMVAGRDDTRPIGGWVDEGHFFTSDVIFNATNDVSYWIAVDGYSCQEGKVVLHWELEETSDRVPEIAQQPVGGTVALGGGIILSTQARLANFYQWYFFEEPILGETQSSLYLANLQPEDVGNYAVEARGSRGHAVMSEVAVVEIGTNSFLRSRDKVILESCDSVATNFVGGNLLRSSIAIPPLLVGQGGVHLINNKDSSIQKNQPESCDVIGNASRRLEIELGDDGIVVAHTIGSQIETSLAAYRSDFNQLGDLLDCKRNVGTEVVSFEAGAGEEFFLMVDGVPKFMETTRFPEGLIQLHYDLCPKNAVSFSDTTVVKSVGEDLTLCAGERIGANSGRQFQWFKDSQRLLGKTKSVMVVSPINLADQGVYGVGIVDGSSGTSNYFQSATLIVSVFPPQIIRPRGPLTNTVVEGQDIFLGVTVDNRSTEPLDYRWRRGVNFLEQQMDAGHQSFILIPNIRPSTFNFENMVTVSVSNQTVASLGFPATATNYLLILPDHDGDGMADEFENTYGLDNPDDDADGDGASNYDEYISGTIPNDPSSFLGVESVAVGFNYSVMLEFFAAEGISYSILFKNDLRMVTWDKLIDIAPGEAGLVRVIDPGPIRQRFYRLQAPRLE